MRPSIEEISNAIVTGFVQMTDEEQRLAQAVYRLVGRGRPAALGDIAREAGWPVDDVEQRLDTWPAGFRNEDGAVVGFWGLAAEPVTHHRIDLDGIGTAWTWCAGDALFIPGVLGTSARVESVCSTTGAPVRLTVNPDGVSDVEPASTAVSLLLPDRPIGDDVREKLCHYVLFFASPDAAQGWVNANPGTFWLPVADAFEVMDRFNHAVFPALMGASSER